AAWARQVAVGGRGIYQPVERGLAADREITDVDVALLRGTVEMRRVEQHASFAALNPRIVIGETKKRAGIARSDVENWFAAVARAQLASQRRIAADAAQQREAADFAVPSQDAKLKLADDLAAVAACGADLQFEVKVTRTIALRLHGAGLHRPLGHALQHAAKVEHVATQ